MDPNALFAADEVMRLYPQMMRVMFSELRRSGHPSYYILLGMVQRRSPTLSEMADYQGVSLPSISSTVTTMEERGWVLRERDTQDRRVVRVLLTDAGDEAYQRMNDNLRAQIATHMEGLSTAQRSRMLDGIRLLTRALSASASTESEGTTT